MSVAIKLMSATLIAVVADRGVAECRPECQSVNYLAIKLTRW